MFLCSLIPETENIILLALCYIIVLPQDNVMLSFFFETGNSIFLDNFQHFPF